MGNIVILGPPCSGKTTYLAGLAYWPSSGSPNNSIVVEPVNRSVSTEQTCFLGLQCGNARKTNSLCDRPRCW